MSFWISIIWNPSGFPISSHLLRQMPSRIADYSETASSLYLRQSWKLLNLGKIKRIYVLFAQLSWNFRIISKLADDSDRIPWAKDSRIQMKFLKITKNLKFAKDINIALARHVNWELMCCCPNSWAISIRKVYQIFKETSEWLGECWKLW